MCTTCMCEFGYLLPVITHVVPNVPGYVSKTVVKDNPIKKSLSKSNLALTKGLTVVVSSRCCNPCLLLVVVTESPFGQKNKFLKLACRFKTVCDEFK